MSDKLCLSVDVTGENIMSEPILKAHGFAKMAGKYHEIKIDTPITSVSAFVDAFKRLFEEKGR